MLDLLRRKAQSPYLQATVLIIIVVFVFWGVGGNSSGARNAVATVNDQPITLEEYDKALGAALDNFRNQFGGTLPKDFVETFGVKQQILNDLIRKELVLQGGEEMGIFVSDTEIQNAVKEMTVFHSNGQFDVNRYREVLKSSRLTPTKFEASLRKDLLLAKISDQLGGFARTTPRETDERFAFANEELRLSYALFSPADFTDQVTVSPAALDAYYGANKTKYQTPLQVKLSYLAFRISEEMENVTIPEEELRDYYASHADQFGTPEQRRASHILLRATEENKESRRQEIDRIMARLKSGEEFAALAREFSEDGTAAQGGDLGFFSRGRMVQPFEEAVFALAKKGDLSEVVTTPFGLHLIQLTDIKPAETTPFADARAGIEKQLKEQKAANTVFATANEAYEKIIFAGSLAKYAENFGITPEQTPFFAENAPPAELAGATAVLSTAFSLKKGELSSLLETPDGYVIVLLADRKEPETPPLDAVRERVEKDYVAQEARTLCRKAAEEALAAARSGEADFAAVMKERKATVKDTGFFSRAARIVGELPAPAVEAGQRLTAKTPYPDSVLDAKEGFYVLRFAERKAGADSEEKRQTIAAQLAAEKQQAILAAWTARLMEEGRVTINEEYLQ